jgi:GNAT superfamily N-acetyltransferase
MARRDGCPDLASISLLDVFPNDHPGRQEVASAAMRASYVDLFRIYTRDEMVSFETPGVLKPSWEQGKEERRFIAGLAGSIVGVADLTRLSDSWRMVEPMHVLPQFWGCGIGLMLWNKCVESARQRGAPGLRVWSLVKNKQADRFYRGRGCKPMCSGTLTLDRHIEDVTGYECRL